MLQTIILVIPGSGLPLFWQILFAGILVIANIAYIFRKQIINIFKKKEKIDLYKHRIYLEKSYLNHKIKSIDVGDSEKSKLFQGLLLIKYQSILDNSSDLIESCKGKDIDGDDFYRLILKNMTKIVDDYNTKFKEKFGKEIFNLIMEHPEKGFNVVHEKTIVFIKGIADETFKDHHLLYKTTEDKLNFLLDLYYIAMKIAMVDVTKIYTSFNGDLTKLIKKCKKL